MRLRIYLDGTSVGGRVFGVVVGLVCAALGLGFGVMAFNALIDLETTISIGRARSRGRLTLDGWSAAFYGVGGLCLATTWLMVASPLLLSAFAPSSSITQRAWRLLNHAPWTLFAAAAFTLIAVVGEVIF